MATRTPEGELDIDGFTVMYMFEYDTDSGPPWADEDVDLMRHGYLRADKKNNERPILTNQGEYWFFDWAAACKLARRDKWNTPPYNAPNQVERAVQNLFDYYKAYLNEEWHYVGITVWLAEHPQYEHAVWGFETYQDYHKEEVPRLAEELVHMYLDDLQAGNYRPREDK